jgi:hypothetical protein
MKPAPDAPPWGDPQQFDWGTHGAGWDYFLLEQPQDGAAHDPLGTAPNGAVELAAERGAWRLYRRIASASR